jgi:hypothetical protein
MLAQLAHGTPLAPLVVMVTLRRQAAHRHRPWHDGQTQTSSLMTSSMEVL